MSLQCHECGSRNTEVVSAKELGDKTGDIGLIAGGTMGVIDPVIVIAALTALTGIFKALQRYFRLAKEKEKTKRIKEERKRKVVVCKDCGFWEKV